ncbi:MAG: hypothetical protein COZ49_02005 [Candidatus Yonathbacteria bacterium CG_4_10_14_3_um_filter_47_65]|uniref:Uncharacterized protein n=2 Tax=Parcubacteria group TaxID=1794811 RepID=A0A2M8D5Z5_9BACT|nr:MAG: hypothetical protein AUJ44_02685 [Candidatus Nomurabacteria bacterium CG1_02_47_685]PIP03999.1 MAG: hypothetical protein COX54_01340 [Candidatus Yonathbacteria bacterium CG23_combo_of_CG06-09_8_20_14_all_46_18]PIQ31216.1 MAG: hypothetical protein COW61_04080 [Candidatus Yonathbacteria bacterium CG17_big_fil_post_rev_8_21_14_2_50_46_19]PIX56454.1 MAG: hypothetical protein COZ49_02005 [Candidatus Yonathbacteria bacterium CG_4_10_14_3_um_filter_47_65]PIY57451.1 MAG: hypothetical protein CO
MIATASIVLYGIWTEPPQGIFPKVMATIFCDWFCGVPRLVYHNLSPVGGEHSARYLKTKC